MKTVKITTENKISIIDVDFNDYHSIQNAIGGGLIETVKTQKMWDYFKQPIMFICDEEGHPKGLPVNLLGCWFYNTAAHGWTIKGDIILAVPEGPEILGLENAAQIYVKLLDDFDFLEEE